MTATEPSFAPVFDFFTDRREITLKTGHAEVKIGPDTFEGTGRVILQLDPQPAILLKADLEGITLRHGVRSLGAAAIDEFRLDGAKIEGFSGGFEGKIPSPTVPAVWHSGVEPLLFDGTVKGIKRVLFHLFNFRDFTVLNGLTEKRDNTTVAIQRVELTGGELKVCLTTLFETVDAQAMIRKDRRTAHFTHMGALERTDGQPFTDKQAMDHIWRLQQFLSFVNGQRCIPVCPRGFNLDDMRVWDALNSPATIGSPAADSWFSVTRPDQLKKFFECFFNTIQNVVWQRPLQDAIYWYLRANSDAGGIDSGIILTQAALELLAYAYAVEDRGLVSAKGFKKLWASDKLRLLLVSIGLPTSIPAECPEIKRLAQPKPKFKPLWEDDLAQAFTDIRNSLVHPDHKHRHTLGATYVEAWKVGLWLVELAVLGICGYDGSYVNRLTHGPGRSVENVPWQK